MGRGEGVGVCVGVVGVLCPEGGWRGGIRDAGGGGSGGDAQGGDWREVEAGGWGGCGGCGENCGDGFLSGGVGWSVEL